MLVLLIYSFFANEQTPMEVEILTFTSKIGMGLIIGLNILIQICPLQFDQGSGQFQYRTMVEQIQIQLLWFQTQYGNPVVVQVGDEYNWNEYLGWMMLWGVWQDDDTNEWVIATVNYIGGRQKGKRKLFFSFLLN